VLAPAAIAALTSQAVELAFSLKPQEICSIVSALAVLEQSPRVALGAIEDQVTLLRV
jgi:hypothetical protein